MPWDCDTYWKPDRRVWPPPAAVQALAAMAMLAVAAVIAAAFIAVSI